jgi:hypothetical protein
MDQDTLIKKIINSRGVKERVKFEALNDEFERVIINGRMVLFYKDYGVNVEAHICSAKESWSHIHKDIKEAIKYLCGLGYNSIYTDVSDKFRSTQNLIKKHGFNEVHRDESKAVFKWVHQQR